MDLCKKLEDFRPHCPIGDEELAKPTYGVHGQGGYVSDWT